MVFKNIIAVIAIIYKIRQLLINFDGYGQRDGQKTVYLCFMYPCIQLKPVPSATH